MSIRKRKIHFIILCLSIAMSLLLTTHRIAAQAIYYTPSSIEMREFIAKQLKDKNIQSTIENNAQSNPHIFTQSNGTRFLVYYNINADENTHSTIRIIPHNTPTIVENPTIRYGTWDIILDEDYTLQKIMYYFQDNAEYNIEFSTYRNFVSITVNIENMTHISRVTVPIAVMTLLRMKFDDIIQATEQYIVWPRILPVKKKFKAYERARHFATYLHANSKENTTFNVRPQEATINAIIHQTQKQLFFDVNTMLTYIGKGKTHESQFLPTYDNGMRLGIKEPTYIRRYTDNVFSFLKTFPEFDTERQASQNRQKVNARYTVRTRLYLYALANPQAFYLIAAGTNSKPAQKSRRTITYDFAQIVVPYFTPSGKFDFYAHNRNALFFKHAEDISHHENTEHFAPSTAYRRVIFLYTLRVPRDSSYNTNN